MRSQALCDQHAKMLSCLGLDFPLQKCYCTNGNLSEIEMLFNVLLED